MDERFPVVRISHVLCNIKKGINAKLVFFWPLKSNLSYNEADAAASKK